MLDQVGTRLTQPSTGLKVEAELGNLKQKLKLLLKENLIKKNPGKSIKLRTFDIYVVFKVTFFPDSLICNIKL